MTMYTIQNFVSSIFIFHQFNTKKNGRIQKITIDHRLNNVDKAKLIVKYNYYRINLYYLDNIEQVQHKIS